MDERQRLELAIAAQEDLRGKLDDEIIDSTISILRKQLNALTATVSKQRKLVSILFTDVVQSTEMIRGLDPEENLDIMDSALKQLALPVEKHGGRVTRFMGDGFKAVFGAPVAHENDPEMAVRAGLEILEIAKRLAGELESQKGIQNFQVRVGINTGLAALGGMTEADDTLMGSDVNLAKRVESAAPPGNLYVSHNTYQHIKGVFTVEPQAAIEAKGFVELVRVYRVLGAKQRTVRMRSRGVEEIETRLIGRQAEMLTLQKAYWDAVEGEKTQVVTLIGEAGMGKSRLVYEFQNWLELLPEQIFFLQGYARQETQHLPYALLRDIFAFRFQIQDSDEAHEVRSKFAQGFYEVLGDNRNSEMRAHITGQLLGYDFSESQHLIDVLDNPKQLRDRSYKYLKQYIESVSTQYPTVIFIDDLHWGDSSSLEMLDRLIHKIRKRHLLIVFLARHRLFDRNPHWGAELDHHTWLTLEPLSDQSCRKLVDEILILASEIPVSLRDTVVRNAEGNPYYVEELIKMLIEDGVILTGEERWSVQTERLTKLKIPPTLTNVLQARLDSLPQDEYKTLQQASVVGRTFWDRIVSHIQTAIGEGIDQQEVANTFFRLVGREMIYRQPISAFSTAEEYNFKHAILREVTYENVLLRQRQAYHGLVADWLIEHAHDRIGEYAGVIADHLERAERIEEAITYLLKAGERAAKSYANVEAVDYFTRAINLAEKDPPDILCLIELHRGRGLTCESIGDFNQALYDLDIVLRLAREADELQIEWRALIDLGKLWASRDYHQTQDYFQQGLNLSRQLEDPAAVAGSLNWMGNWHLNADNPHKAVSYHLESLEIIEQMGNPRDLADTLDLLGLAYLFAGDSISSVKCYDRSIALCRKLNERRRLASSLMGRGTTVPLMVLLVSFPHKLPSDPALDINQARRIAKEVDSASEYIWAHWSFGLLNTLRGDYGRALTEMQNGLRIASEIGHREWVVGILFGLGIIYTELYAPDQAREHLEEALTLARKLRSPMWIHLVSGALAAAYFLLDELELAEDCLETVISAQLSPDSFAQRYCWARRAELAMYQGDLALALDIIERLILATPGITPGRIITFLWMLKGETLARMGNLEKSKSLQQAAIENAQAAGERFLIWRLYASLGRIYAAIGQQSAAEKAVAAACELIRELADTIPSGKLKDDFLQRAFERLRSQLSYSPGHQDSEDVRFRSAEGGTTIRRRKSR